MRWRTAAISGSLALPSRNGREMRLKRLRFEWHIAKPRLPSTSELGCTATIGAPTTRHPDPRQCAARHSRNPVEAPMTALFQSIKVLPTSFGADEDLKMTKLKLKSLVSMQKRHL